MGKRKAISLALVTVMLVATSYLFGASNYPWIGNLKAGRNSVSGTISRSGHIAEDRNLVPLLPVDKILSVMKNQEEKTVSGWVFISSKQGSDKTAIFTNSRFALTIA